MFLRYARCHVSIRPATADGQHAPCVSCCSSRQGQVPKEASVANDSSNQH